MHVIKLGSGIGKFSAVKWKSWGEGEVELEI